MTSADGTSGGQERRAPLADQVLPLLGAATSVGAGGPPVPPPTEPAAQGRLDAITALMDGALLLGLEVDTRYRVLAMTIEPADAAERPGDARRQLLWHPVGRLAASLRERVERPDGSVAGVVRTFEVDHLPDVVAALDAPSLAAPFFGRPEPTDEEWGPVRSLDGRAQVPDGRAHVLRLDVAAAPVDLALGFLASFDAVDVRDAQGADVAV